MKKINLYHIFLVTFLLVFVTLGCNPSTSKKQLNSNQQKTKLKKFFSEESIWNQAILKDAEIDSRSEQWVKMLEQEPTGENFGIACEKWTIPIYEVDQHTPVYNIKKHLLTEHEKKTWNTINNRSVYGHGYGFNPVPIPDDAQPDPENDSHFAVVDWDRMLAWDMWGLEKLDDGSYQAKTGMVTRLDGDGVFDGYQLGYVDKESVHFHGPSRAAGVPAYAGVIRYDEVMSGQIKHKLACATRYGAYREFTYPATWTDGIQVGGIPQGAIIQLDPQLDLKPFDLTIEEKVIVKALQEYGAVIVDMAMGQPIYAEGLWGHPNKSWDGKIREWDGGISDIPFKHYRVLKVDNTVKKGDTRVKNIPKGMDYWSQ